MKTTSATAIILALSTVCTAQQVMESVSSLTKQYRPLFGTKASTISVDFLKNYQVGSKDTSYLLVMSVGNQSSEAVGYSVGATVFDMFSAVSVSNQYAIKKTAGKVSMDRVAFLEVYDCINKVFKFTATRANYVNNGKNALCTCGIDGVMFGGEHDGGSAAPSFYFRVGDDATFSMNQAEFSEIMRVMNDAKRQWVPRP
jgi:hypothetical protein